MGRTLEEMIAAQLREVQAKIEARTRELVEEAHGGEIHEPAKAPTRKPVPAGRRKKRAGAHGHRKAG
jgi:hypothetical protein